MRILAGLILVGASWLLSGCVAVAVVDTAASVTGTVISTTADVAGSVVSGVAHTVSGGSKDKEKKEEKQPDKDESE